MDRELKEGFMTTKELASWFGISYDYFRKKSKEKYEELKSYCEYERVHGGVRISAIYNFIYVQNIGLFQQVKAFTEKEWHQEQPESATRVGTLFYERHPNTKAKIRTIIDYTRRARHELWGSAKDLTPGERGGCHYVFVKMFKGDSASNNKYMFITPEEYKQFIFIQEKYFKPEPEKIVIAMEKVSKQQWSKDIAFDYIMRQDLDKNENYRNFVRELASVLGCHWMVSATYVKDGVYFIEEKDENGVSYYREITIEQPNAEPIGNSRIMN